MKRRIDRSLGVNSVSIDALIRRSRIGRDARNTSSKVVVGIEYNSRTHDRSDRRRHLIEIQLRGELSRRHVRLLLHPLLLISVGSRRRRRRREHVLEQLEEHISAVRIVVEAQEDIQDKDLSDRVQQIEELG